MKIHRTAHAATIVTLASMAFAAAPAGAQPLPLDTIEQTDQIDRINEDTVAPALAVVTGNQLMGVDPQGDTQIVATATNGLRFEVSFRACEAGAEDEGRHCKGMYMRSIWDAPDDAARDEARAAIANYALRNPAVNSGTLSDGSPYIIRYVIADYGTKQGNLVSEFSNFIRSATDFQNSIAGFYGQAE